MQPTFSKVNTISSVLKISCSFSFRGTRNLVQVRAKSSLLGLCRTPPRLGENQSRVIVPVKGDYGIKALALLALEAFEQLRMPVGEQLFDLVVGKGAVCLQAEHGQPALRVVAADNLAVELHHCRFRTWDTCSRNPCGRTVCRTRAVRR